MSEVTPAPVETKPPEAVVEPVKAADPAVAPADPAKNVQPKPDDKPVEVKFDVKLPDGALLKADQLDKIVSFAKEHGLSEKQAQAIVDRENAGMLGNQSALAQMVEKQKSDWFEAAKIDKEIGGEGFAKNAELAKRAIDSLGSEALKKELNESGLGNHPELIRFASKMGKLLANDEFVKASGAPSKKKSLEELWYPPQQNKEG